MDIFDDSKDIYIESTYGLEEDDDIIIDYDTDEDTDADEDSFEDEDSYL